MPSINNITIYDGATTPVEHTLIPVSISKENGVTVAKYRENDPALPVAAQIRFQAEQRRLNSGVYRLDAFLEVPVMEQISGGTAAGLVAAPQVAHVVSVRTTVFAHERSTNLERTHGRMLMSNLLRGAAVSVPTGTGQPMTSLVDDLVSPT